MDSTVCYILCQLNEDKDPDLDVKQCLDRLTQLPGVVLDTSHIFLHASNGFRSVGCVKEPRARWFVG